MKLHALRSSPAASQRGVALIVSLILLVVMTLLGLAAIRNVTMEERMAGYAYDRSLAFQATEAALRAAELLVESVKPMPTSGTGCNVVSLLMVCDTPAATATPRWQVASFASWHDSATVGTSTLAVTPQYFAEYLGNTFPCNPGSSSDTMDCKRYRISARSNDGTNGRASVMLQSVYATD